ncbi:hypothetical protein [Streptococcus zalophi]|uniref:hypothetical protein n=1 Tax=Streptococcus zalophi TaxID=640031 RepID=UPI00215CAB27|nr:hypothetical protein [Streptococcus zalophi]MCR8968240.1 hypothetical protein [Streptococcus zalophi]
MVKIEIDNINDDSNQESYKKLVTASEALMQSSVTSLASIMISELTELQKAVAVSNTSSVALASIMISELTELQKNVTATSLSSVTSDAINKMSEAIQQYLSSLNFDYSKIISQLTETLKSLQTQYSDEEIEEITSSIQLLAENGWVIYFELNNIYQRAKSDGILELEFEWLSLLEESITNEDEIQKLQKIGCYSKELVLSMVDCYEHKNYYAAYTLASLSIDGALNRLSEIVFTGKKIPVGHNAVKKIKKKLLGKGINDIGLFYWLSEFFGDTFNFTIDKPNRHMVGHGRWDKAISKTDFLKLFNVMLYIRDAFPCWKEFASLNLTDGEEQAID